MPSSSPATLGRPDPKLTPRAGLHLVAEVDRALGATSTLDHHIGPVKTRRRGLTAGELVLAVAETMLGGGDFMADLGNQRADTAGATLRAVPGDLGSGKSDPRPQAPGLTARAVGALPEGLLRPVVRAGSGFFDAGVARAALKDGADYAVVAKRNPAAWRACRDIPAESWRPAIGMGAEVSECDYVPAGWPPATRCVVRRVKVGYDELRADPRSRRRRTIDPGQLRLLEEGETGFAYAYSFVLTNLRGDVADTEAWSRMRALVEERIKDSKWGLAMAN